MLTDTLRHLKKSVAPHILMLAAATAILLAANEAYAAVVVVHPLPRPRVGGWFGGPVWIAPPPPRVVVAPARRPGWIWSAGYWNWTGSAYVWIDGAWLAERPGLTFVPAHWVHIHGGWQFIGGGWIRRPL